MAKIWLYNVDHPGGKLHEASASDVEHMLANGWYENPGDVKAPKEPAKKAEPAADAPPAPNKAKEVGKGTDAKEPAKARAPRKPKAPKEPAATPPAGDEPAKVENLKPE